MKAWPDGRMRTMTRSDLITAIASRFPNLMAKDAEIAVKEILDAIECSLAQGDRGEIHGFGSFSLNYRPARTGRNPKSGEGVPVAPKYLPYFQPHPHNLAVSHNFDGAAKAGQAFALRRV